MKTAILLGNGPSVDQFPAATLCPLVDVYGANFIGVKFKDWGVLPKGVIITDSSRLEEIGTLYSQESIELYVGDQRRVIPDIKVVQRLLGREFTPLRQITRDRLRKSHWLEKFSFNHGVLRDLVFSKNRYSFDAELGFNFGNSVVIAGIQLLISKGYTTILLSGVDSRYRSSKDYLQGAEAHVKWVWEDFTKNPRLFMEPHLVALQILAESVDVKIIDCTPGGALRFITKGEFIEAPPWYRLAGNC